MKKFLTGAALVALIGSAALAQSYPTMYKTPTLWYVGSGGTLDVAGTFKLAGTAVTSSAAELNAMDGVTATFGELNYNDVTTLGTLAASKTWTSDASLDTIMPTGGLLTVQSGGGVTFNTGSVLTVDGAAVSHNALALTGRAKIRICGDATTVNNNTIYYGPSQDIQAGYGRTCDITQAGNATEATADEPAFTDTAFQVLSMNCLNDQDANANISFTLRSAAAATTPSVTCTIADNARSCTTATGTTTAIASGATLAIAAASSSDVGTAQFMCELDVAF